MNRVGFIGLLTMLLAVSAYAQDVSAPADSVSERIYVRIQTNAPDAFLYADTAFVGPLSAEIVALPAEVNRVRLVAGDRNAWSIAPVERRLDAAAGDTVEIQLDFPYHYRIESIPFGAKVYVERGGERVHLGSTPLLHASAEPVDGLLAVERSGYAIERVELGRDLWNRHVVMLKPSDELDPTAAQVTWKPPKKRRAWIDYAALGTAVAAGVFAVHYKFKADDLYATYEETADPSLRDEIHSYDVRSGVAFGVMQAGIGVFALRLVLR